MKTFLVKYVTYEGVEITTEKEAHNKHEAERQLTNCREVVWCREKTKIGENKYHIHRVN